MSRCQPKRTHHSALENCPHETKRLLHHPTAFTGVVPREDLAEYLQSTLHFTLLQYNSDICPFSFLLPPSLPHSVLQGRGQVIPRFHTEIRVPRDSPPPVEVPTRKFPHPRAKSKSIVQLNHASTSVGVVMVKEGVAVYQYTKKNSNSWLYGHTNIIIA